MVNPHLPQPDTLRCQQISIEPDVITITVESMAPQGICPLCGRLSSREHSRYKRQLSDLPWQGRAVRLNLLSKKYFCDFPGCARRIFVARLREVATAYARKTVRLVDTLANIAFTCGGEAGSRLANRLGMPTSADTLLRTIRKTPVSTPSTLRIVGVDDWAMRKGLRYGTLICDLEQHRPIDVLDDREPETVAAWFRQHPEIEVVTRDRAHCYSEGVSQGAPQATQVADRFHLIQNLRKALSRMLEHHYPQMALAMQDATGRGPPTTKSDGETSNSIRTDRLPRKTTIRDIGRKRRIERYERVIELNRQGKSYRAIARCLNIHRDTVGKYIRAGECLERATRQYASKTDEFTDYLLKRWNEGCQNAAQLARELEAMGFTGSYCSVRRRVANWARSKSDSLYRHRKVPPPSAKKTAWLLLKKPDDLEEKDREFIDALFRHIPDVQKAADLSHEFSDIVHKESDETLDSWMQRVWDSTSPKELKRFATGLKSDFDAVNAGLTTAWNNGQLEGQVNRLKFIKRQMYGRANFDLLRQRVLYSG